MPRQGLKAKLGDRPILPIARELVELSCASLAGHGKGESECVYLEKIRREITGPGKTPAETLLEKWEGGFKSDPGRLIDYLRLKISP